MKEPQENYNLLKAIRDIFGTQRAFADALDINEAQISMAVKGKKVLTGVEKRAWASALKSTVGYLWPDPE